MKFFNRIIILLLTLLVCTLILTIISLESTIQISSRIKRIWRRGEKIKLDCGRVLRNDKSYISQFTGFNRIEFSPDIVPLSMSCQSIKNRIIPSAHLKPLKVGVVFARNVYQDYEFLEKQVQSSWHFQNHFCFYIDSKSDENFKLKMEKLGKCLKNVHVLDEDLPIDSAGHNTNLAHYRCMQKMLRVPDWGYFILMQNHDVIGKSVYEISRIFEILAGANDVDIAKEDGRIDEKFKWDLKSLKFFRNEGHQPASVLNKTLRIWKGAVQGSLSRKAVNWMVNTVNPRVYFEQWNEGVYGVDEQWISTFHSNEFLEMPGHFTDQCLIETGNRMDFISRWTKWSNEVECESGFERHSVCIIGIEGLSTVAQMPNIMFNKMLPSFDYSIVECTAELIYNRTFLGQNDHPLEEDYYSNMINVLYHKHHMEPDYQLNCTPSYVNWNNRKKKTF